jgi:hypothetical protein
MGRSKMIKPVCSGEGEREGEGRKRRGGKGREGKGRRRLEAGC